MTLAVKAVKGVKWTTLSTLVKAGLQLLLLAIAARFLDAQAFGLYAVVQITLGFSQLFMDMGIGNAIIQSSQISRRLYSELFTINFCIALIVSAIVFLLSDVIADFFNNIEAGNLIKVVSVSFIFSAMFRIHLVSLQKELAFNLIAKVEILAQLLGFAFAVFGLCYGYGVLALVLGYMVNLIIQGMLFFWVSPVRLKFVKFSSFSELRPYLGFGLYQTADSTVNYFNSQFDLILIGKLLGSDVLGGYMLVRQFCFRPAMLINPILTRVAFPLMSKLKSSKRLSAIYCQLSAILATINIPVYLLMALLAEIIIEIMFGSRWLYLTPVFQVMALWCLVRSTMNPVGSLMMAIGKVKQLFKWNLSLSLFIPVTIIAGINFDLLGVTIALVALQVLLFISHIYILLKRHGNIVIEEFIQQLGKALILACSAIAPVFLATLYIDLTYLSFGFLLFVFIIIYGFVLLKYNKKILHMKLN